MAVSDCTCTLLKSYPMLNQVLSFYVYCTHVLDYVYMYMYIHVQIKANQPRQVEIDTYSCQLFQRKMLNCPEWGSNP